MDKSTENILITGGILAIVYFGIVRPITNGLGLTTSAADAAQQNAQNAALQQMQDAVKNQTPTKSAGEWLTIADQIYNDLRYTSLDDNKADAVYQVCRVQNNADLAMLNTKFGYRQEYAFGVPVGSKKNLASFLTSNLSASQLSTIRDNHIRKGLTLKIV